MASSNILHHDDNATENIQDDQIQNLARELINSTTPTRELTQIQTLVNTHRNLQTDLQPLIDNNPLVERLNNHSQADIETAVDSVDSFRCLGRICQRLNRESLSVETTEVINNEGTNIINNIIQIYSRTTREIQQAIGKNERTANDPIINNLLQQQMEVTATISTDPRLAYRQIKRGIEINNQLEYHIEQVESDVNADVRRVLKSNSKYLKCAVKIFFIGAAAVTMGIGIPYLTPIIIDAIVAASASASIQTVPIIQSVLMVSATTLSRKK